MAAVRDDDHDVRVRVLGVVAIERDEQETVLTGKAALAISLLASRFPHSVSRDSLFELLWDEDATTNRANSLRVLIHRLRSLLGSPELLPHSNGGYRLDLAPAKIDSVDFERLVEQAANHLADGQIATAYQQLDRALLLWCGETAGTHAHADLSGWQTHLENTRLDAQEQQIQVLLDDGDASAAAVQAQRLADERPYRERRWEQLMLALYRCGRQQEALEAAAEITRRLHTDLGVQPGPSLRQLEVDILQHAEHLEPADHRVHDFPLLPALPGGALLGRDRELEQSYESLDQHRVVTITGPGGIGKTSLAVSIAHHIASERGEVWWCDLSTVRPASSESDENGQDRSDVAFRVGMAAGIRSGSDRPVEVAQILRHRSTATLVLDNCEHVVAEVRALVHALSAAPNVAVLATSRHPLDVSGEAMVRVGSLDDDSAGQLFERVALASNPQAAPLDHEQTMQLCSGLDGMPLAIELVARRVRSFSLQEIQDHLPALLSERASTSDRSERHATIANALAWSIELLSEDGRVALGSAAVFPGSFDLVAFEAVVGGGASGALLRLEELIDHGFVQVERGSTTSRYLMLAPIRQHVAEHVASSESLDRSRHADHYLARLEAAYDAVTSTGTEHLRKLVLTDLHNLAAVHHWAIETGRLDDDLRLYRPLNIAHLYDRPEPFLWAQETVAQADASGRDRFGDALHAAWHGALAIQLDVECASALAAQLANVKQSSECYDLAQLGSGLHRLLVHHDYGGAEAHFRDVALQDPYVRYVATSVGASVRLTEATRGDLDAAQSIAAASASIEQSLSWARSIAAEDLVAGLVEQQAQVVLAAGGAAEARSLARQAADQAAALGMGHVQAQAQFQMVRCDVSSGQTGPEVAKQLAHALGLGIRSSAQARLRWQLPLAAQVLVAHGLREVAALSLAVSGFAPGINRVTEALSPDDLASGVAQARRSSLLDIATDVVRELRTLS